MMNVAKNRCYLHRGDNMNKKKKIIFIGALVIALVVISNIFTNINNNKEYNKYLSSY